MPMNMIKDLLGFYSGFYFLFSRNPKKSHRRHYTLDVFLESHLSIGQNIVQAQFLDCALIRLLV